MCSETFIKIWQQSGLKERSASQSHFNLLSSVDSCRIAVTSTFNCGNKWGDYQGILGEKEFEQEVMVKAVTGTAVKCLWFLTATR